MDAAGNSDLIADFYTAFAERDGEKMAGFYAPDAHFWDPVFRDLTGDEPGAMWKMLTGRAADLELELVHHDGSATGGSAHWRATYTFSQTGRCVVNDVHSDFVIEDGKIKDQRDEFDFYKWSRQALGLPGLLLGWTPIVSGATHKKARAGLDEFIATPVAG